MANKRRWMVDLSEEERARLLALLRKGTTSVLRITRARILLLAAENRPGEHIAAVLHCSRSTVERVGGASWTAVCMPPLASAPALVGSRCWTEEAERT